MITDIKHLRVQFDDTLLCDRHLEQIKLTALPALGLIRHAEKFFPQSDWQKMYIGIVQPHFSYCYSVWGCCCESKLDSL